MKRFLITLHRWVGFPLGILFTLTVLSGIVTGFDDLLDMLKGYPASQVTLSDREMTLGIDILAQRHSGARQIALPNETQPVFTVIMRGERYVYASDLTLLHHEVSDRNGFFPFVLRLHRNYLLGRQETAGLSGAEWVAWVGLISLAISLLGIYLWWPHKRTFKLKRLVPTNNKASSYYFSHLTAGIVTVGFILRFAITGAGITYRAIAQSLLLPEPASQTSPAQPVYVSTGWKHAISTAKSVFPDGELVSVSMSAGRRTPPEYANAAQFRFHTNGDWFGLAGSVVYIDKINGAYLGHQAFADYPAGQQVYELLLPLHTGRGLTPLYLVIMLTAMSLTLVMVVAGITSFVRKKSKLEKQVSRALTSALPFIAKKSNP